MVSIDSLDGYIWLNGDFVEWKEAKVHVLTHGLHYASSVFEGERCYNGKVFKAKEHQERLLNSCKIMDLLPFNYTADQVTDIIYKTIEKNKLTNAYVRPLVWRGSENMGIFAADNSVNLMVATWDWPSYFDPKTLEKGISIDWAKWRKPDPATEPVEAKASGLYMIGILEENKAHKNGFNDALFLDYRGYIAECSSSNVFFVMNGELHTPTPRSSLNGITRQTIIEIAREKGYKVYARDISPEELENVQEVFVTGTAAEVTPVGKIGDKIFKPSTVTKDLRDAYLKLATGK
jgi:branched-chain amino acid aminotransferase